MTARGLWESYKALLLDEPALGFRLDVSRMGLSESALAEREGALTEAHLAMEALERGGLANPDEKRMVGHYWLRAPERAPTPEIAAAIRETQARVLDFAARVHDGRVLSPGAERFRHLLVIGIGGSALGPQLVADALGGRGDRMQPHFLDNTDPDGFDRVLGGLGDELGETLVLVISKSGGTPETRNGMLEAAAAYAGRGLDFARHAVAITQDGSALDRQAREQGFLERFPMWDWVGGRSSVTSAVGLVPAALQGIDVEAFLAGAAAMDELTRRSDARRNPAALLALAWHVAGEGRGTKAMVVLPYKDRLLLFSRYLQQLVMESIGKEKDLAGRVVHQGLTVYGNKGSTDQHAFVQQLRDGTARLLRELRARAEGRRQPEPRGRAGRDERRLPRRPSPRDAAGAPRERSALAHDLDPGARPAQPRDADRAVRAGRGALREPRRHQRLPPAGRRGGEEGGGGRARAAAKGAGRARRAGRRRRDVRAAGVRWPERRTRSRRSSTCSSGSRPTRSAASPGAPARQRSMRRTASGLDLKEVPMLRVARSAALLLLAPAIAIADVQTKEVSYKQGETELQGFFAWDGAAKGKQPGVVVVHEWWGHNQHARNQAIRLAKAGYVGFALDMYGKGKVTTHPEDAQAFMAEATKDPAVVKARFLAALDLLKKDPHVDPERVAAIGYCFGGGIVLAMARQGIDLDAVVSFHGVIATQQPAAPGAVKARLLVLNGEDDGMITAEQIAAFKQEMTAAHANFEFVNLPHAKHAFTNPDADKVGMAALAYNADADKASFDRMLKLFAEVFPR